MAYTAASIITGALNWIGIGRKENLDQINDIINNVPILNQIIAKLAVKGTIIQATIDEPFVLTAGLSIYTIGLGQTPGPGVLINALTGQQTSKPLRIESAYIVDSQKGHYPVEIITREQFNIIIDQELSQSRPTTLFFDPGSAEQTGSQLGTISLYYIPDPNDTYTLHLNSVKPLTGFVNTTDAFNFDISYVDYFTSKLGIRLAPAYGITVTQDMKDDDRENEKILEMANWRKPVISKRRPSGRGGTMNPYTGTVNES